MQSIRNKKEISVRKKKKKVIKIKIADRILVVARVTENAIIDNTIVPIPPKIIVSPYLQRQLEIFLLFFGINKSINTTTIKIAAIITAASNAVLRTSINPK